MADFRCSHPHDVWHGITVAMPDMDTLIYNAGILHMASTDDHSLSMFTDQLQINLIYPFAFARAFLYELRQQGRGGDVIFTSSMATHTHMRNAVGYVASKCGLEGMCRALAREYEHVMPQFTFNCIAPATVEGSEMHRQIFKFDPSAAVTRKCTNEEIWRVFDRILTTKMVPPFNGVVFPVPPMALSAR